MTIQKSGGHWSRNATVKAHRPSFTPREALERAQCRAEDYVGDASDMRERVTEIMRMLAQPPRANEYSGHDRRAL